jgi:hypothetical protein
MNKIMGTDSEGARSDLQQGDFKTGLCDYYNAMQQPLVKLTKIVPKPYQYQSLWCPVLRKSMMYEEVTAAHIVPRFFGAYTMAAIFGESHTSWSMRNDLLIANTIEKLFDQGQITIVPVTDSKDETELKIRILEWDQAFLSRPIGRSDLTVKDLQDRPLIFLGEIALKNAISTSCTPYIMALKKCEETWREEGRRKKEGDGTVTTSVCVVNPLSEGLYGPGLCGRNRTRFGANIRRPS